jgi:hypothetical protein
LWYEPTHHTHNTLNGRQIYEFNLVSRHRLDSPDFFLVFFFLERVGANQKEEKKLGSSGNSRRDSRNKEVARRGIDRNVRIEND